MVMFLPKEFLLRASFNLRFLANNDASNIFEALRYSFSSRRSIKAIETSIYRYIIDQYKNDRNEVCIALKPFFQNTLDDIDIYIENRLMQLFLTSTNSLALIILIVKSMCSIFCRRIRVYLYHSLEVDPRVDFYGEEECLHTKYDIAILYINMRYFIYVVDKTILVKRKHVFWSDGDQHILEILASQNLHLSAKGLAK